jgi:uncharacterized protein
MLKNNFPKKISIFPLSSAIFFPRTVLPLNIFEDRYIKLVNDCMKDEKMFGMVQPRTSTGKSPEVYQIGCLGKIVSFNETVDKRFVISLSGIIRFRIKNEINENKLYREFNVDYSEFISDLEEKKDKQIKHNKNDVLNNIKKFFKKINYPIDNSKLAKLSMEQLANTVSMISPFTVSEKQKLIETVKIEEKITILEEIIKFNLFENTQDNRIQ